ncbi:MAG: DEAD/DEAH box helicase [Gammaproteobacteria bacterium]|nr:MAG: DEAD/DEAH box helicase [Gammaproteobacteria bacterium]RKZ77089.1 MAG: DEAD/DEAH box helicase [Gammaproteobacteria bacterium]
MAITIAAHGVESVTNDGLSWLQNQLLTCEKPVRIADAPTGAGKSFAFQQGMIKYEHRVLFIVPTKRLAQNLIRGLLDDLVKSESEGGAGWDKQKAQNKVSLWSSDGTQKLRDEGITKIGVHRVRELFKLDETREGGEMIIAVPESVNYILLRDVKFRSNGQTDVGIFHFLNAFDHIVFDEFHTIQARGFGLAAIFAKLAAALWQDGKKVRAKISFLSATPINIMPVLKKLDIEETLIESLSEKTGSTGRIIHGDVQLQLANIDSLPALMHQQTDAIRTQIAKGRQTVVIYNKLEDLQRQINELEQAVLAAGIAPENGLLINSIDDSRADLKKIGRFTVGRNQNPLDFDLLITTSSVEMGVTFKADLLLIEPGFEAMNFLQRYGRVARGNYQGQVFMRFDEAFADNKPWLRELWAWYIKNDKKRLKINSLTDILCQTVAKRFKDGTQNQAKYYARLSNRAVYTAGLYWHVIMNHFTSNRYRQTHLKRYRPKVAQVISRQLYEVRKMATSDRFKEAVESWCQRFEQETITLRDIEPRIRIIDGEGQYFTVPQHLLQRATDIVERFPMIYGKDGIQEIRIAGKLEDYFLDKNRYIPKTRSFYLPNTMIPIELKNDYQIVNRWCAKLEEQRQNSLAWDKDFGFPQSMQAAMELVQWTGLVIGDDTELDTR